MDKYQSLNLLVKLFGQRELEIAVKYKELRQCGYDWSKKEITPEEARKQEIIIIKALKKLTDNMLKIISQINKRISSLNKEFPPANPSNSQYTLESKHQHIIQSFATYNLWLNDMLDGSASILVPHPAKSYLTINNLMHWIVGDLSEIIHSLDQVVQVRSNKCITLSNLLWANHKKFEENIPLY